MPNEKIQIEGSSGTEGLSEQRQDEMSYGLSELSWSGFMLQAIDYKVLIMQQG